MRYFLTEIYGSAGQVRNFGDGSVLTATGEINAFSPIEIEFETSGAEELKFIVNKGNQLDPSNPTAVNNSTVYGSTFSVQYDTYETSLTDGKIYSLSEFSFSEFSSFSNVISNAMAQNGASQSRVLNEVSNLNKKYEKLELANSRITDTDFALEATKLARNKLLLQSSAKMIGTATNLTKSTLKIMGQKNFNPVEMLLKKTSFILESVDLYFNQAARALDLPKGLARQIRTCNAICEMKFGVELRGGYEIFTGWRGYTQRTCFTG